jgi:pimeloyl-ACP methyl ester carboxylesterase
LAGVTPIAVASALLIVDPVLARLLLPFREVLLGLGALQLALSSVLWRKTNALWPIAPAALAMTLMAFVGWTEYAGREEAVSFQSGGTQLRGTLYHSVGSGPHPAIVLAHGSGKFSRRMYRYWGQKFSRLGFDVLIYDKRGVGESEGEYEGENNTSKRNIELLTQDLSSAVDFVAARPNVTAHVGIFGLSQGGWLAALAASRDPRVKFLVLHSGPVVSVGQQNLYESLAGGDHKGSTMPIAQAQDEVARAEPTGFDPRPSLESADVRALWIFGTADRNVPVSQSVANLDTLAAVGKSFEYKLLSHADHLLLTGSTRFSRGVESEYWSTIVGWMERNQSRDLAAANARL